MTGVYDVSYLTTDGGRDTLRAELKTDWHNIPLENIDWSLTGLTLDELCTSKGTINTIHVFDDADELMFLALRDKQIISKVLVLAEQDPW